MRATKKTPTTIMGLWAVIPTAIGFLKVREGLGYGSDIGFGAGFGLSYDDGGNSEYSGEVGASEQPGG
ncbi:MAG: hypothetical protein FWD46_04000 [Cystobacterineae bacterium]|nr:hypothetical protein [Cystobacterineae bacterium]